MTTSSLQSLVDLFQRDLIGILEQWNRWPDQKKMEITSAIKTFQLTLSNITPLEGGRASLHEVLFRGWIGRKNYESDFDIPYFENGLDTVSFLLLIDHFDLYEYTASSIYQLSFERCLTVIEDIITSDPIRSDRSIQILLPSFIRYTHGIDDGDKYNEMALVLDKYVHQKTLGITCLTQSIKLMEESVAHLSRKYKDLAGEERNLLLRKMARSIKMMQSFSATYGINHKLKRIVENAFRHIQFIHEQTIAECYVTLSERVPLTFPSEERKMTKYASLEESFSAIRVSSPSREMFHQKTFVILHSYIKRHSIQMAPLGIESPGVSDIDKWLSFENALKKLPASSCKNELIDCVQTIKHKHRPWVSVLHLMLQYIDLWIAELFTSNCEHLLAPLVCQEHLLKVISDHVHRYQLMYFQKTHDKKTLEIILHITKFMFICLNSFKDIKDIHQFRDCIHFQRNFTAPLFGSLALWDIDFEAEIIKLTNQITSLSDDTETVEISNPIIKRLSILSALWPHELLYRLFILAIENTKHHQTIIPVITQLGDWFRWRHNDQTLLTFTLNRIIHHSHTQMIQENTGSFIQLIKGCCTSHHSKKLPLILISHSDNIMNRPVLNLKDLIELCLLPVIGSVFDESKSEGTSVPFRFVFEVLLSFCCDADGSDNWKDNVQAIQGYPSILYSNPSRLLDYISQILWIKINPQTFCHVKRLSDFDMVIRFKEKLSDILRHVCRKNTTAFPIIFNYFRNQLAAKDWKYQIGWYEAAPPFSNIPRPFVVPDSLVQIIGEMDGLFRSGDPAEHKSKTSNEQGWMTLFEACLLSTYITDYIFEQKDRWTYNLILLWTHPYDNTLIHRCFYRLLRCDDKYIVSSEYPRLLVHFLRKLFDSFENGDRVLIDHNERHKLPIQDLSKSDFSQYFIILHISILIREHIERTGGIMKDGRDTYYISGLLRTIQDLANWNMITEQMSMDQHKEMRFSDIKKVILTEAHRLHPANTVPEEDTTFYTSFPQFDPKNNPEQEHMIDQYYFPFLTAASISRRALSIATLCILCTLQSLMKSEENEITDMIKRLMMMILEGLVDKKSSKNFQSILWSQPKTRFNKWRRDPKRKAIVFKRPVFSDTEKQIVKPYLEILNPLSEEAQLMNRWFNLAVEPVKKFIYVAF